MDAGCWVGREIGGEINIGEERPSKHKGWIPALQENGKATFYDMNGARLPREFSFGTECEKSGVLFATLNCNTLGLVTGSHQVWAVADVKDPRPVKLSAVNFKTPPKGIAVLPPKQTLSGGVVGFVPSGPGVWELDDSGAQEHVVRAASGGSGPTYAISHLCPSPDGQLVALFGSDGKLIVVTADLSRKVRVRTALAVAL